MKRTHLDVHLNLNIRSLRPSATLAINERVSELIRDGREVFRLGFGQSPFPVPETVVQTLRDHAHEKDYLPVKGLRELRDAVAAYNHRSQGMECSGEDVLIGPGSKELLFLLQLVYYGELVIPTPSWVSYSPQARIVGRHVQWVKTSAENDWRLVPEELEMICSLDPDHPRIVVLNFPANPTGATYSIEQLKGIARIARKYRVILLSDEIYGELHHKGSHISMAQFYPEGTIVSSGLSKWCGAGGWRLGTFTFPQNLRWLLNAMASVASETYTATSAPIQYAAVTAFEGGKEIEEYLYQARRVLSFLGTFLYNKLSATGITMPKPEGGFYLFPDFSPHREKLAERGITSSTDLCEQLLENTGVSLLPSVSFGRPPEELTARLSYVDFDGKKALSSAMTDYADRPLDEVFLDHCCPAMVEATHRICEWISERG